MMKNRKAQQSFKLNLNLSLRLKNSPSSNLVKKSTFRQKARLMNILKDIVNKNVSSKIRRKVKIQKNSRLPSIKANNKRKCSPTKMNEFKKRMFSPITTRNLKFNSTKVTPALVSPLSTDSINRYMINCTEEQSIINDKVRLKVLEARMSRFAGFKSPRILLSKLTIHENSCDQYDFDCIESSNTTDAVQMDEKLKSFNLKAMDISSMSL